ncbi:uncharacterized protein LOC113317787 [Papaver somniferum]|uniref:uncharacterized protein LOC113317787 n=1 Tax=Papaver somniferum TaxID=3469 RepID=UPI000E6F56BE|nr:uncharacterized protein LOC113317787 [Papaver somniferum]
MPAKEAEAIYWQLFLYDPAHALSICEKRNPNLSREVLATIQDTLLQHNIFTPLYRQAHEILKDKHASSDKPVQVSLHFNENSDKRRYNLPAVEEVSIIVPEKPSDVTATRDILLHLKDGSGFTRIDECHPAYLPLHYVLLFPYGELGWSTELAQWDGKNYTDTRLSHMQFFDYRLFERKSEYSTILRGGKLFQEFLVDVWASTEQNRLDWLRFNQRKLRADHYASIIKMKEAGIMPNQGGTPCVLPSSHIGSPRHMYEIYQDSMAITRFNHHPDIFLTMTANPNWTKIKDELKQHQYASDRPDLVARVFELKRKTLMNEITKKNVFGEVVAHVHTIEFQKRGLPHMHALIFLEKSQKIRTVEQVDEFVSAEFPDEKEDPILFDTVRKCMVHGPCGDRDPEENVLKITPKNTMMLRA